MSQSETANVWWTKVRQCNERAKEHDRQGRNEREERDRYIRLLHDYGLSVRQIATYLGMSSGTVGEIAAAKVGEELAQGV